MLNLFENAWMKKYKDEWNKDPYLAKSLSEIRFSSIIGYGFPDEDKPRACIVIKNGYVIEAGNYNNQKLNWDLRAKEGHWKEWIKREVGSTGLGLAYTTGKLKFVEGDYKSMIKNPTMSSPFIKSFSAMGRV
ncbi:MAG: SCP-2 sterol transfer family protein [Gammaproteobacteria bacterium]|nr:SCP-2 sterol transfer family protein [Gammaproteobacteria bacterium]